ncbi:conserved hypothetical protein [Perkinsus marinus ATCC 50983]|uniref:Uncharacterized protein n=2 Tax=Perkinsus marinus (strain ATCC 50983 / TXsc) TaxID=423536 RepID=C5L0J0_PERM5|nr:conserved hypothetical protein [Perkinsus marinus ATCC 50983]EER09738.1 conserved hypothetical protein [Perkinsus marinus ATCC 50983]|eukprot:XP_002777943.1 conserved hypothetical protein [Perkinsus marinus ATCC 50983]
MNVSGPDIDRYASVVFMPWAMKPWLGVISDSLPMFGYHKLPYMMILSTLGLAGTILAVSLDLVESNAPIGTVGLFMANLQLMGYDLLAEAVYSRRLAGVPGSGPALVSYVWTGNQLLGLVAVLLVGFIVEHADGVWSLGGAQWAILTTIFTSATVIIPAGLNFFEEKRVTKEESRAHRKHLWGKQTTVAVLSVVVGVTAVVYSIINLVAASNTVAFVTAISSTIFLTGFAFIVVRPVIGKLMLFNAISQITIATVGGPAIYFYTNDATMYPAGPHFSDVFYGSVLGTVGQLCSVLALLAFGKFMKNWKYRTVYFSMTAMLVIMQLGDPIIFSRLNVRIGIPDQVFAIGSKALVESVSMIQFMPGFLILSHLCPKNMEATMFALLASLSNYSQNVTRPIAGFISQSLGVVPRGLPGVDESEQFDNLWIVSLILISLSTTSLFFLWLIPNARMNERIMADGDDTSATSGSLFERWMRSRRGSTGEVEVESEDPKLTIEEERNPIT